MLCLRTVSVAALGLGLVAAVTAGPAVADRTDIAVVIGNRDYQDPIPDVAYAHQDADAFTKYLTDVAGVRPGNIIQLRDASLGALVGVFGTRTNHRGQLFNWVRRRSDVVVYYSGHGVPGQHDRRGYLLPVDAAPDLAELQGYAIDLLYGNLGKLSVASVTVFLDACFSGESPQGMIIDAASPFGVRVAVPEAAPRVTAVTAAGAGELASWDTTAGHGLFTAHLLHGLYGTADEAPWGNGDGAVALGELSAYLEDEMSYCARRHFNRQQHPGLHNADPARILARLGGRRLAPPVARGLCIEPAVGVFPPPPGTVFRDCPDCPEMVVLPRGDFLMGSPPTEEGRFENEGPQRRVSIDYDLAVGKYEVTLNEWNACLYDGGCDGFYPQSFQRHNYADQPVTGVSWEQAQSYIAWLNRKTELRYRLPSEAEWEYAARAGTVTPFHTGRTITTDQANYNGSISYGNGPKGVSRREARPVGSFAANRFGLHDMHGNAWEWVADCAHSSYHGAPLDGSVRDGGNCAGHMVRSGDFHMGPSVVRSAARVPVGSDLDPNGIRPGFRVGRDFTIPRTDHSPASLRPEQTITRQVHSWREPHTGMEFIYVPGGTYVMGCDFYGSYCISNNKTITIPLHPVTISDFWIGKYEITQREWRAIMGSTPGDDSRIMIYDRTQGEWRAMKEGSPGDEVTDDVLPVHEISWNDVRQYVQKLNEMSPYTFRLPTEAEWEYACRTGGLAELSIVPYYHSLNYNPPPLTPVTETPSNRLGLYGMPRNVSEWVEDSFADDAYVRHAARNPRTIGPPGSERVRRGSYGPKGEGGGVCSIRWGTPPDRRDSYTGARLVLER